MIPYRCGCVNTLHHPTGALRRVSTCDKHKAGQRDPATLDEAYYRELGALDADAPAKYIGQLTEALGPVSRASSDLASALEIGCGASPYADAIREAGYLYHGVDPSPWAADWAARQGYDCVVVRPFEDLPEDPILDLILAAHVFEHLADAPTAIAKAGRMLARAGELWIVIPDDSDPINPDHVWHFSADSLRRTVEMAGLTIERLVTRQYIEREQFLYLRAVKP